MSFELNVNSTRSINSLIQHDVIEFESTQISKDLYMIVELEKDDTIPAILLRLWRFEGGYNHAFRNVMENDLGLNRQLRYFEPNFKEGKIIEITEYRREFSEMSPKEELFFDVWASKTSNVRDDEFNTPYKAKVQIDNQIEEYVIPSWTPIQKLPLDRIQVGTIVEIWDIENRSTLMKVLRL